MTNHLGKFVHLLLLAFALLFLNSCKKGISGANGDDPFGGGSTTNSYSLTLQLLDVNCQSVADYSFTAGDSLCVRAKLTNNGSVVVGQVISFSTELGSLTAASKLTDSTGIAQITLTSNPNDAAAAALSAQYGESIASVNYEFLSAGTVDVTQPRATLALLQNGQNISRFKADESATLQVTLLDENAQAIDNAIVTFIAQRGELVITSALTNANGVAQVTLNGSATDLGAGTASAQIQLDDTDLLASINYEIQSASINVQDTVRLGYFDGELFIDNALGIIGEAADANVELSAGATLGFTLALVDQNGQRILSQTPVSFSSSCVSSGLANIDLQVNTINGIAQSTFEDTNCGGNQDVVTASVLVNNATMSVSRTISILPDSVGSITFVSAQPSQIVLQGTGGNTISTLIFQVKGSLGNALAQQNVTFSLNTQTGGLSLSPLSAITNSQGQVSTRVASGNVPTSVRVTAEVSSTSGNILRTQSDLLSVNTGLPDQNSFTLSASDLNPEAYNISGQEVSIIARLADTFNNPAPDGTAVSFTTEGGIIEPSCITAAGTCSVTWTSANPKTADHRITILATAIGHETLFDANGNNSYDDADGPAILDGTDSGLNSSQYGMTGFVDYSEAWRDDNANNVKDTAEIFLDYNSNGQFDGPDSLFNGPQCNGSICGQGSAATMHIRRALELIMASSDSLLDIVLAGNTVASNYQNISPPALSIARSESLSFSLNYSDTAVQPIPSGSTIEITSTAGLLGGQINLLARSTNKAGAQKANFTLTNDRSDDTGNATTATINIIVITPSGVESTVSLVVTLP
jgi:hypothetical protein